MNAGLTAFLTGRVAGYRLHAWMHLKQIGSEPLQGSGFDNEQPDDIFTAGEIRQTIAAVRCESFLEKFRRVKR